MLHTSNLYFLAHYVVQNAPLLLYLRGSRCCLPAFLFCVGLAACQTGWFLIGHNNICEGHGFAYICQYFFCLFSFELNFYQIFFLIVRYMKTGGVLLRRTHFLQLLRWLIDQRPEDFMLRKSSASFLNVNFIFFLHSLIGRKKKPLIWNVKVMFWFLFHRLFNKPLVTNSLITIWRIWWSSIFLIDIRQFVNRNMQLKLWSNSQTTIII